MQAKGPQQATENETSSGILSNARRKQDLEETKVEIVNGRKKDIPSLAHSEI